MYAGGAGSARIVRAAPRGAEPERAAHAENDGRYVRRCVLEPRVFEVDVVAACVDALSGEQAANRAGGFLERAHRLVR
jgi:hypothetical protein